MKSKNFSKKMLTLVAVATMFMAGSLASADTIQQIANSGNSVTYGNLVFSDFAISGASNSLSTVNASNVNVAFVVNGGQVTLQFSPTVGSWKTAILSQLGSFDISYSVTALGNYQIISASQTLDSSTPGEVGLVNIDANLYSDAGMTALAGQMSVKDGLFGQNLNGSSTFNPTEDALYTITGVDVAALVSSMPASVGLFSQSYQAMDVTPTPEPGTLGVLGLGGLAMILHRRKARKAPK